MTTTTKTARKLLWTSMIGLCLALGACGQGGDAKKDTKDAKDAKGKTAEAKGGDAKKATDVEAGDTKAGDTKAEPVDVPLDERVVKAASLAKKIEADPSKTDEILAEAGLDRASFEALIYEVSTPELAEQYRLARARG